MTKISEFIKDLLLKIVLRRMWNRQMATASRLLRDIALIDSMYEYGIERGFDRKHPEQMRDLEQSLVSKRFALGRASCLLVA